MKYKRLTLKEREKIHALVTQGKTNQEISIVLNWSHTTISRELKRCGTKFEHSPSKADKKARKEDPERERKKWISHESIYKYIYAFPREELRKLFTGFLRSQRKLRKDRSSIHSRLRGIPDATPISERPKEVESSEVPGHWEGDFIIGKNHKSALGTLVERTTRYVILVPIPGKKDTKSVREAFSEVLNEIDPSVRLSMTYDRGLEMAKHKILTEETGVKVYFADPSSP